MYAEKNQETSTVCRDQIWLWIYSSPTDKKKFTFKCILPFISSNIVFVGFWLWSEALKHPYLWVLKTQSQVCYDVWALCLTICASIKIIIIISLIWNENTHIKNWTPLNFLNYLCVSAIKEYITLKVFFLMDFLMATFGAIISRIYSAIKGYLHITINKDYVLLYLIKA